MAKGDTTEASAVVGLTKQDIRNRILAAVETKVVPLTIAGVGIEWHQPSIQQVQTIQNSDDPDRNFMIALLVHYSFVPSTKERIFEDSDYDQLLGLPYGGEIQRAMKKISDALDLGVEEKAKN